MSAPNPQDVPGVAYFKSSDEVPSLQLCERLRTPLCLTEDGAPTFVISKYATTAAFKQSDNQWIDQTITCIADPLGVHGETLISQRRAERPQAKSRPAPKASLEEETFKALFPIFAHPENEWLLSALVEGIENSNILGWIYKELDTLADKQRVDNLKRKILLNPSVPEDIVYSNCVFCNVKQDQVIDALGMPQSAVSIHNAFPFGPVMHKVLILQQRKHDISEITPEEVFDFYELLHTIATKALAKYGKDLDGITYGLNYGLQRIHKGREVIASGASQPHLHSQVSGLTDTSFNAGDRIGLMCKAYSALHNRDYLDDYLAALRAAGLVLYEDENAVLYVPIAQRFNYEVQIMAKSPKVGNILDTSQDVRKSLGRLEHLAYQIYQHPELNIQSFNTVLYGTRFSAPREERHRLIINVYPRTTIIALSELANRNVVDSFPWHVAAKMRGCMEDVLTRGPRKLTVLVVGAHPDDIELGCGGILVELKKRNHEIHALIVTDGCGGADRSPETREIEANKAARIIGIASISFGRIRDGQAHPGDTLFNLITAQFNRHLPDVVISHAGIHSEHSDHKNVSAIVQTVCARQDPPIYPLQYEVPTYQQDSSFTPNIFISIDGSVGVKKKAIEQHRSEMDRGTISVSSMEARAVLRASEIGSDVNYAEAFAVRAAEQDIDHLCTLMPFLIHRG